MSLEDKNIDQMFSDAAHSQKAPQYDPAYWAEMNAMLNARDAKKRGFLFWAFGGTIVFAGLFLSLFIFNMDLSKTQERYTQVALSTEMQFENVDYTKNAIRPIQKNVNTDEKSVSSINKQERKNTSTESNKMQSNSDVNTRKNSLTNNKNTRETKSDKSLFIAQESKGQSNSLEHSSELDLKNENSDDDLNRASIQVNEMNHNHTADDAIQNLPFEFVNVLHLDEAGNIFHSNNNFKPRPRLSIYAKLGGGLMENYKTSRPYESGLIDLSLNLEGNFNGIILRTGVGAQHTSNADLILSKKAKVYGFGVTRHQRDLSYQSLFDLYIPLEFGYRINATSFGVGVQANYLINTGMDLNHYEDHFLVETEKYYGNTDGLNKFSTQGYLWMEHQLTSRIALGAKVGTNISGRIKDDSYFNQSSTTNPIYGQITLRFNILQ